MDLPRIPPTATVPETPPDPCCEERTESAVFDNCNVRVFENNDWSWHCVIYASIRSKRCDASTLHKDSPDECATNQAIQVPNCGSKHC